MLPPLNKPEMLPPLSGPEKIIVTFITVAMLIMGYLSFAVVWQFSQTIFMLTGVDEYGEAPSLTQPCKDDDTLVDMRIDIMGQSEYLCRTTTDEGQRLYISEGVRNDRIERRPSRQRPD